MPYAKLTVKEIQHFKGQKQHVQQQAIGCVKRSRARQLLYNRGLYQHWDRISIIRVLLAVKHGYLELHLFSSSVLNAFIEFLCTS